MTTPSDLNSPLTITESDPPMPPADAPAVRATWWRLRCRGTYLPAEHDVILIDGGRR